MKKIIPAILLAISSQAMALTHDEISMYCKQDDACTYAFKAYAYQKMLSGFIQGLCDAGKETDGVKCAQVRLDNVIMEMVGKDAEQQIMLMIPKDK